MRIVAATLGDEEPLHLRIEANDVASAAEVGVVPGVPSFTHALWTPEKAGRYRVVVGRRGESIVCHDIRVRPTTSSPASPAAKRDDARPWLATREWDEAQEALFSAWVTLLFRGDIDRDLAFSNFEEVVRDPERNWLHDALGWGEDSTFALRLRPDCADTPYFLRAYFAWKQGLPFGFYRCSRGQATKAPSCQSQVSAHDSLASELKSAKTQLDVVSHFFRRTLAWGVHTGNGRVALDDPKTELYPLPLLRQALRPGSIYADPYGHILVVAQWVAPSATRPGLLLAVDGQPDESITRKRFWQGNFLYNPDPKLGGTGFKAFRPIRWGTDENSSSSSSAETDGAKTLHFRSDAAMRQENWLGGVLPRGAQVDAQTFYDEMDRLMNPQGIAAEVGLREVIAALAEQTRVRVTSVENGRQWQLRSGQTVAEMPDGFEIFETVGTWEDFSTPARDLRLLVAMDVVANFEARVKRHPDRYGLRDDAALEQAIAELRAKRDAWLADAANAITYIRSDGSKWTLTLAELMQRQRELEIAYNPNSCVETRWGAKPGTQEYSTCKVHAPSDQVARMERVRDWFRRRERPARGQH
jgi:hypothetical protein